MIDDPTPEQRSVTDERMERLRKAMEARSQEERPLHAGETASNQWRRFGRTALFFTMIIVVAMKAVSVWKDFVGWRSSANDPSARDAYVTFMEVDVSLIVLTVFAAVMGARLLRARPQHGLEKPQT